MKPRLESLPLTKEDRAIFEQIGECEAFTLNMAYFWQADRRDAELMHYATYYRAHFSCWNPHTQRIDLALWGPSNEWIDCGGALNV